MPFKVQETITVCLDYGERYKLPQGLVSSYGIDRQDHVALIPTGKHHDVPLEVVGFEGVADQDIERQIAELREAGRRPAIAEEFRAAAKVLLGTPREFSISADGTSFRHPHGRDDRFVFSLIRDDWPWREFAAWPNLRNKPGWRMLVAPLQLAAKAA